MNNSAINVSIIQSWINEKLSKQAITDSLASKGFEPQTIADYLKEYSRLKNAKRQMNGFILMAIGAFLGFIACVFTIINVFPDLHDAFLYGLTSVAITIAFYGMYIAFES